MPLPAKPGVYAILSTWTLLSKTTCRSLLGSELGHVKHEWKLTRNKPE